MPFAIPVIGGFSGMIALWITQAEPITTANFLDQLPNYGIAGLVVGLLIWGLNYFNKREDKIEVDHKVELKDLKEQLDRLKRELDEERIQRRREQLAYLDQINILQQEITDLKVKLAVAEQLRKNGPSN